MTMLIKRTVAPTVGIITAADLKAHLRFDDTSEDALLAAYALAASQWLDGSSGILGRALINQTYQLSLPAFCDYVVLPFPPFSSLNAIQYVDDANTLQTASASLYITVEDTAGAAIALKDGQSWPSAFERPDAVRITFVAGYGSAGSDVPEAIRVAARMIGAGMFGQRGDEGAPDWGKLDFAVTALLSPYRIAPL